MARQAPLPRCPLHPHRPLGAGGHRAGQPRSRAAPIGRVFRCGLAMPGTLLPRVPALRCPPRPARPPPRIPTKGRGWQVEGRGGEQAGREPAAGRRAGGAGALTCAAATGSGRARADPSGAHGAGGRRPGRSGGAARWIPGRERQNERKGGGGGGGSGEGEGARGRRGRGRCEPEKGGSADPGPAGDPGDLLREPGPRLPHPAPSPQLRPRRRPPRHAPCSAALDHLRVPP